MTAPGWIRQGRLVNLGAGGLLVAVDNNPASVGDSLEVDLRLDAAGRGWIRVSGHVVRVDPSGIAIAFREVSPAFHELLGEMSASAQHHDRRLSVILIDATDDRRAPIAEAFRVAGCQVIEAATPLEAIVRLGESSFEPDLIAISDSSPAMISDELREFVEREHPRVKLVTIGDAGIEPAGMAHWLSSANPGGDLLARIRLVLGRRR